MNRDREVVEKYKGMIHNAYISDAINEKKTTAVAPDTVFEAEMTLLVAGETADIMKYSEKVQNDAAKNRKLFDRLFRRQSENR